MNGNAPDPGLIDHVIQKDIVKKLVSSSTARFSELKPNRVESNLFSFHLKQLIKNGVVVKNDNAYQLSTFGSMYVDRANLERLEFRIQPKIVTILAISTKAGRWLLLERLHEPHMHRRGFPSGKIHYGESLEDAAKRELLEKAGFKNLELKLAGNVAMRFIDKASGEVINHTLGYIFRAELDEELEIKVTSEFWKTYWGDEAELLEGNVFKGHQDILELLASKKLFIRSLDYDSDY